MSAATTPERGKRKAKVGRVVSDKMDKTIVVSVERLARHRIYKRVIRLTTKFKAHDENNEAHVGDTVRIEEARPLSATKRSRLAEIVTKAGLGAAEDVVGDEPETAEAIHGASRPVKVEADHAAPAEAELAAETPAEAEETTADAAQETTADAAEAPPHDEEASA